MGMHWGRKRHGKKLKTLKKQMRVLLSIILALVAVAAQAATLKGKVTSADDGLPLPGASITIKERPGEGVEADNDGAYLLTLPQGKYTVICEVVGFTDRKSVV